MINRIVTVVTLLSFMLTTLYGPVARAEEAGEKGEKKQESRGIITIVGGGGGAEEDEGWSIVRLTPIEGRVIVVSEKVGSEVDLTERNYYGLFQGETIYKSSLLQPIQISVDGFKSATFIQLPDSTVAVKITYGVGDRLRNRSLRLRKKDELKYIRDYFDRFEEINRGTYKLRRDTPSDSTSQYPLYTEQKAVFEETVPFYRVAHRMNIQVTRKDGGQVRGEVIPTFDGQNILVETDVETQKISRDDIAKVKFTSFKGGRMMTNAVKLSLSGALSGALIGALSAWQTNTSVGESVLWASTILGAAGFLTGLMTGGRNRGDSGGEFTLGPVKEGQKKEKRE
ncbi:MAG: hypothetical protein EXS64_09705 [Candidatus Latescibacteria bacterium]|nr:hypothetical protein [Candidatus Latescibacterota bacterium]